MSKSNVFTRAKALRKSHPNTPWQKLVQMAAGKKVSSPKKTDMATRKKSPSKKSRVSGVRTTVKKKTVKRRSVGAIVDSQMAYIAGGMALTSVAQGLLQPLILRLPANVQKFSGPVIAIAAYKGSTYFKQPLVKGIMLGLMKGGVDDTVSLVRGTVGRGLPGMGATYIDLPSPNLGEIRDFLGADYIPQTVGYAGEDNSMATLPNMGYTDINGNTGYEPYLPLGWDA